MSLDDLDQPTLRLVGRCIEWKRRYGYLWVATVWQLSDLEPESKVEEAIHFLGLVL